MSAAQVEARSALNLFKALRVLPAVLFDGKYLQVLHWSRPSEFSFLTFDIMHARANGRRSFGSKLSERLNLDHIAVVPKSPCWYPAAEMEEASLIIAAAADRPLLAYGASMGGYGALKWGKKAGAAAVLACSPQATIAPDVTGQMDKRYGRYFDSVLHADMAVHEHDMPTRVAVLFDDHFAPDRFQAELLGTHLRGGLIKVPHMSHGTAQCIAGSSNASAIFLALLDGDIATIRKRALAARKRQPVYRIQMATTALRRGKLALALDLAQGASVDDPVEYHMFMARYHAAQGNSAMAADSYRATLAIKPWHRIAEKRLAAIEAASLG